MHRTVRGFAALLLTMTVASLWAVVASGTAGAGSITITAGPSSTASCTLNTTAKLSPGLKNDWIASPSDSVPAVAALPTTQYASAGPVAVSAKGNGTCTGTATDGVHTAAIAGVKKLTLATDPAHPGGPGEATCTNLVTMAGGSGLFNTTIEWNSGTAGIKIANTVITDSSIGANASPLGFKFSGGTVTGSFAGGSVSSISPVTTALIDEVTQAQETGAEALANSYTSLGCEPTLKVKTGNHGTKASLKGPKGLKKIAVTGGTLTASA